MSSEWYETTLGEICKFTAGSAFKPEHQGGKSGQYPFIKVSDMNLSGNEIFIRHAQNFVSAELKDEMNAKEHLAGATVFAKIGVALQSNRRRLLVKPTIIDNNMMSATPKAEKISSRFLYFLLSTLDFNTISAGSALPYLNVSDLQKMIVTIPRDIETQHEIEKVLGVLDDRITLLRETNTTLEAIAQALFKSWFVDFDPVHAKMQGRVPESMDEATAALFPDSFEDSGLGPVPKGWSVGSVGDFARLKKGTVNPGSQPDIVFEHFSLPAFDDGQNPVIEFGASIKSNKTPVPEDAVLLSKLNPHIPRIWLPVNAGRNAVCSTEFLAFQPTGVGSREFIYCLFSSPDFISRLQQLVTGTSNSHQRIKPDQIALMTSVVPAASVASAFEILTRPIFERVHANRQNVQTLSAIRHALLPRLISGQLRVSEALEAIQ